MRVDPSHLEAGRMLHHTSSLIGQSTGHWSESIWNIIIAFRLSGYCTALAITIAMDDIITPGLNYNRLRSILPLEMEYCYRTLVGINRIVSTPCLFTVAYTISWND